MKWGLFVFFTSISVRPEGYSCYKAGGRLEVKGTHYTSEGLQSSSRTNMLLSEDVGVGLTGTKSKFSDHYTFSGPQTLILISGLPLSLCIPSAYVLVKFQNHEIQPLQKWKTNKGDAERTSRCLSEEESQCRAEMERSLRLG